MTYRSASDARFARAVAEFNSQHFYEAHEIWESLWDEEVGEQRLFLQALVQAAAGFHKAEIGVPGGARKLWSASLRILEKEPGDTRGIDVAKLCSALRRALAELPGTTAAPTIEVRE